MKSLPIFILIALLTCTILAKGSISAEKPRMVRVNFDHPIAEGNYEFVDDYDGGSTDEIDIFIIDCLGNGDLHCNTGCGKANTTPREDLDNQIISMIYIQLALGNLTGNFLYQGNYVHFSSDSTQTFINIFIDPNGHPLIGN